MYGNLPQRAGEINWKLLNPNRTRQAERTEGVCAVR